MANIVGRARALDRGYYPDDGTHCRIIEAGEEFNLVEGLVKGSWFEVLHTPEAKPKAEPKPKVKADAKPKVEVSAEDIA